MSHLYQSSNIRFIFGAFSPTSAAYANLLLLWCGLISITHLGWKAATGSITGQTKFRGGIPAQHGDYY
jgi:hypothetical protein